MGERALTTTRREGVAALRIAVVMYLPVLAVKLGVYLVTGVLALLAEALHTLSDLFISGFLLVAVSYGRREQDEEHMFGHGRVGNVAALVAATLFISSPATTCMPRRSPGCSPTSHPNTRTWAWWWPCWWGRWP